MDTETEQIVAVLHDVVEDSDWTLDDITAKGASIEILEALDHVTKRNSKSYDQFIRRVAENPIARKVKLADLRDNMDLSRILKITDEDVARINRYAAAFKFLSSLDEPKT